MIITSKYNAGDTAWFYSSESRTLLPCIVERIMSYDINKGFFYEVFVTNGITHDFMTIAEYELVRTPDEFIKSLKDVDYTKRLKTFAKGFERYVNED